MGEMDEENADADADADMDDGRNYDIELEVSHKIPLRLSSSNNKLDRSVNSGEKDEDENQDNAAKKLMSRMVGEGRVNNNKLENSLSLSVLIFCFFCFVGKSHKNWQKDEICPNEGKAPATAIAFGNETCQRVHNYEMVAEFRHQ